MCLFLDLMEKEYIIDPVPQKRQPRSHKSKQFKVKDDLCFNKFQKTILFRLRSARELHERGNT